jgi:hypothetical protein
MDDVLQTILDLMKNNINYVTVGTVKSFYKGKVNAEVIPRSNLRALMVYGTSTNVVAKSTCQDQYVYSITIKLVDHLTNYIKEAGVTETIKHQEAMYNLVEDRETTGVLKADTVLGILRANIRTDDFLFNNEINVDYSIVPPESGQFWRIECDVNFTATTDILLRP